MKLVTSAIKKELAKYPLGSQDGKNGDAKAIARFFFPMGAWTWYVTEANLQTGEAFGVTINGSGEGEYGYFNLNELQSLRVKGFSVERDICFTPTKLKDIKDEYLQRKLKSMGYVA